MPLAPTRFLLLLMLTIRCWAAFAQTPIHRRFTTEDGLPSNTVYAVVQDHEGYLWFATDAGVSRFDGNTFVNFGTEDGLPDPDIINIFQDSKHRIWFLGFNGRLGYYLDGRFHNMSNNADLARFRCPSGFQSVVEDAQGMLWFGGVRKDILRLDLEGDNDRLWELAPRPLSVGLDEAGRILMVRGGVITVLRDEQWVATDSLKDAFHNVFIRPTRYKDHGMIALSSNGLMRIRDHHWEAWVQRSGLDKDKHQSCWLDAQGTVWVRLWKRGVERWSPNKKGHMPEPLLLFPEETINFIFTDRDRNVWFTTPRGGVMLCLPGQVETIMHRGSSGPVEGSYLALERDRHGTLWAGTAAGQIFSFSKNGVSKDLGWDQQRGMGRTKGFVEDRDGRMHVACDNGTFTWDATEGSFLHVGSVEPRQSLFAAKDIAIDRSGVRWLASFGLYRTVGTGSFDGLRLVTTRTGIQRLHHVACDPEGRTWFSTLNELRVLEGDSDRYVPIPGFDESTRISDLAIGAQGELFVATTDKGVHVLRNGVREHMLDRSSGLVADRVDRIRCYGDTLLLSTSKGLQVLIMEQGRVGRSWVLGASSVLATDQVNDAILMGDRLFAATGAGLCEVPFPPPDQFPFIPQLRLSSITVNGQRVSLATHIAVALGDRVGVVVQPIDYANQRGMEYQYRLDPTAPWATAKSGTMEFAGLKDGAHELQMRVRRPDGIWSRPTGPTIEVVPPWWDHVLLKVLLVVVLLAVTGLLVRNIITRSYRRALARERERTVLNEERRRISADVHDDLGAELSNVLMHVRNAARITSDPVARNAMDQVGSRVTVTIGRIDEIIWSLDPQRDNLRATVHFIEQQASDQLEAQGIAFRTEVAISDDDLHLSANRRREIWLIVREALRNVVKHARATTVSIAWTADKAGSTLIIEDDGEGLPDGAFDTDRSGLKNMRDRAMKIGATFSASTSTTGGTRIEVRLPQFTSSQRMRRKKP